jgi:iron complex outermembrane recepter protein
LHHHLFPRLAVVRYVALVSASVTTLVAVAAPAAAQQATPAAAQQATPVVLPPADAAPPDNADTITVTGSRIVRDGYTAPTPVSVLSSQDIQAQAPPNIANFVNQLPAISGSSSPASSTASLSGATAGISSINLRSLGNNRTLVLVDGQRSVASSATGLVDINTIPQTLVERVEVVTGGASAAYGSDAVGGVVNFILKKNYTGLQLSGDYGETTYGDGRNYNLTATAGAYLLDKRLHIMANVQYFNQAHISNVNRSWNETGYNLIDNPDYTATNGQPRYIVRSGTGPHLFTPGGLVVTGPLTGTYFGLVNPQTGLASVNQLTYGRALSRNVSATNGGSIAMLGGDWRLTGRGFNGSTALEPGQERIGAFVRATFEVTPFFTVYASGSYNRQSGESAYLQPLNNGNLVIQRDNAYLPDSVRAQMVALNLTTLRIGTSNAGLPVGGAANTREVYRYVIGANGDFDAFGSNWKYDVYWQRGFSRSDELLYGTWLSSRIDLATDAVRAPAGNAAGIAAGTIVCRSTLTNPNNGCIPMNRIGEFGQSQASIDYVLNNGAQPQRFQRLQQDVVSGSFSGNLFTLPGGIAAIAFGGEWRRESIDGTVDPQFANGWQYGNYRVNRGAYNVADGFAELSLPVLKGVEVNGAVRVTNYSTSGTVATWKIGASWQIIEDIRVRGNVSRDIRAPNLDELFSAGTGRSNTVQLNIPGQPSRTVTYQQLATGNPNLQPEKAQSWTVGGVFTPRFLPGFAASIDYYQVKISGSIGSLQPQDVVNLCFIENVQAQCDAITIIRDANGQISTFNPLILRPINYAFQTNKGIDFDVTYRTSLASIHSSLDGRLTARASATHYISNLINDTLNLPRQTAGQISSSQITTSGPPSWTYRLSAIYDSTRVTFSLIGRGYTSGVIDNNAIACTSACPAFTASRPTIDMNRVGGAFYVDTSLAYKLPLLGADALLQLTVTNLLNRDPTLSPNGPTGDSQFAFPQTSRTLGDRLGRTFRLTARITY